MMCFMVVIKQLVSDDVLCLDVSVANRTYYKTDGITVNYGNGVGMELIAAGTGKTVVGIGWYW